ncbi:MAG: filamentous hemagglutinin N-terminal domain-containing protein [Candidatus Omnitrophica bacterium]|nr:filamentous hemagglutinin N-terminal domain-containing protein [Candidatus Omnitrophota bacterium]
MWQNKLYKKARSITALVVSIVMMATQTTFVYAQALPANPTVVDGNATFNYNGNGQTLTVNQNTPNVQINWGSFNIGTGQQVIYNQPSSVSTAWNVASGGVSQLLGSLSANGFFALINPSGIFIGPQANINTAGFLASTLNAPQSALLNGLLNNSVYNFIKDPNNPNASIVNQGTIQVSDNGQITLIGGSVQNDSTGSIIAKLGKVNIASGEQVALTVDNQGLTSVAIDQPLTTSVSGVGSPIVNLGNIIADGGIVTLTAKTVQNVFQYAINNQGVIKADALVNKNGEIYLTANDRVNVAGDISALGGKVRVDSQGADYSGTIEAADAIFNANDGDTIIGPPSPAISGSFVGNYTWRDNLNIYVTDNTNVIGSGTIIADYDNNGTGEFGLSAGKTLSTAGALSIHAGQNISFGDNSHVFSNGPVTLSTKIGDIIQGINSSITTKRIATLISGSLSSSFTTGLWYNHDTNGYSNTNLPTLDFTWGYTVDSGTSLSFTATAGGDYSMLSGSSVQTNGGDISITAGTSGASGAGHLNINTAGGTYHGFLNAGAGHIFISLKKNLVVSDYSTPTFRAGGGEAGFFDVSDNNVSKNVKPAAFGDGSTDPVELSFNYTFKLGSHAGPVGSLICGGGTCTTTGTADLEGATWVFSLQDGSGNSASLGNFMFDWTKPVVSVGSTTGTLNPDGSYLPDATVSFNATDNLSGFSSQGGGTSWTGFNSQTTSGLGAKTLTSTSVCDEAGNCNTGTASLTIHALLSIIANSLSKVYGDTATLGTTAFTTSGTLYGSDSVTGVTLTSAGAAATANVAGSPYDIVPSAAVGSGLDNYIISYVNGALTVTPAALTITANDQSKTFGDTFTFAGTEFTSSGLVNADTVDSVTLTSGGAAAGATVAGSPYAITPSAAVGTGLSNYEIAYLPGLFTVNPGPAPTPIQNIFGLLGDEFRFKIPAKDFTNNFAISYTQGPISFIANQVFFYHPLAEVGAPQEPALDPRMYDFINGNITYSNPGALPLQLEQKKKNPLLAQ